MSTMLAEIGAIFNLQSPNCFYGESDEPRTLTFLNFLNYGQMQSIYLATTEFSEFDMGEEKLVSRLFC